MWHSRAARPACCLPFLLRRSCCPASLRLTCCRCSGMLFPVMTAAIAPILETYQRVIEEDYILDGRPNYRTYAISSLRGGVGKTSLCFNLAYELSRKAPVLVADLCPQRNLTELFFAASEEAPYANIIDALRPAVLGPAFGVAPDELAYRIGDLCTPFKGGKKSYFIPGSSDLFAFPASLYQQLQMALANGGEAAVSALLLSLSSLLDEHSTDLSCTRVLLDTSPFYAGGTHLAWCAADALIVPVRVDEHSLESLDLTLRLLTAPDQDFARWNERGGGIKAPKIAAVVMTMVGAKSQVRAKPDNASCMYIERALAVAEKHGDLFINDPADHFVLLDDFHSAGRISGAKSIPIARLAVGSFHTVEGKRLQVNASNTRYQRELRYLASLV